VEFSGAKPAARPPSSPASVAAHDDYLRARQLFYQRTPQGFAGAVTAFERALQSDPTNASAHAGAAAAYVVGVLYAAFPQVSAYTFTARALAHADRAIELDSLSGEALAARGFPLQGSWGDWDAAERDLAHAVRLQPSSADALGWQASHLTTLGRHDEALLGHDNAIALDPVSPGRRMAYVYSALGARLPDLGVAQVRRARAIQPNLGGLASFFEALSLAALRRPDECLALEDLSTVAAVRATCLHMNGQPALASLLADSVVAAWTPARPFLDADALALYFAATGDVEDALLWVGRALDASPSTYASLMWPPALWDPVLAVDESRIRTGLDSLRSVARERVLNERRRIELP
jgi:Tfp pilus assembly protein PilF